METGRGKFSGTTQDRLATRVANMRRYREFQMQGPSTVTERQEVYQEQHILFLRCRSKSSATGCTNGRRMKRSQMEKIIVCPYSPSGEKFPSKNFGWTLFESIREHSTSVAMEDITSGQRITYEELGRKAEIMARHLLELGCKAGDVFGIFSQSSIEWVIVTLAAWRIGSVVAGISPLLTVGELKHHLALCKPKFLYTVSALAKAAVEVTASSPCQVIVNGGFEHCIDLESLFEITDHLPELPTFEQLKVKPDDPAMILFSSGTTGQPKAVLITHYNLQSQLAIVRHPESHTIVFPEQVLFMPFSHIAGADAVLHGLALGYKSFLLPRFHLHRFLKCIQDNKKLDSLFIVPPVAILLAKSPEVDAFQLNHLKLVLCVAAPFGADSEELVRARFPKLTFIQAYGLTEVCGGCLNNPKFDTKVARKPGSVGVPSVNVKAKIVDIATGASLGPNERGELCLQSPGATPGYKDNPEATAALIDKDGWIHTGDIGYYDEDGFFYIVDRLKELIKYNAYQVAPTELESILMSHPQVADAGVVGMPHPSAGELPTAWVVLKSGATVTAKELDEFVSGNVAAYKRLRGGINFVSAIPRSSSGKILRRMIKEAMIIGKL